MPRFRVVVTDYEYESLEIERRVLEEVGAELVAAQLRKAPPEKILEVCRDADALIVQYASITRRVVEGLEKCRVIARYGVCLLYTSPSPRDLSTYRMPSSA